MTVHALASLFVNNLVALTLLSGLLVFVCWRLAKEFYGADAITFKPLQLGLLLATLYVTVIVVFACVYVSIYGSDRTSFSFNDIEPFLPPDGYHYSVADALKALVTVVYFSTTVITSTGFGDIHPRGSLAMIVVTLEMWTGYFLTIVLFATMAGLAMARRSDT